MQLNPGVYLAASRGGLVQLEVLNEFPDNGHSIPPVTEPTLYFPNNQITDYQKPSSHPTPGGYPPYKRKSVHCPRKGSLLKNHIPPHQTDALPPWDFHKTCQHGVGLCCAFCFVKASKLCLESNNGTENDCCLPFGRTWGCGFCATCCHILFPTPL